jgi:hypothetical protein
MFTEEELSALPEVHSIAEVRKRAVELSRDVEGMRMEFGTGSGGSTHELASAGVPGPIYTFDWFQGLPEKWSGHIEVTGSFSQSGVVPPLPDCAVVVNGLFADTLPGFMSEHSGPVAFVHVDCDLYSSTKTVFDHVAPRFVDGTIILFDELCGYPSWRQHEIKALEEASIAHGFRVELVERCGGERVTVRVRK